MEINEYLSEIKKITLLEPAEEEALWKAYKKDNNDTRKMSTKTPMHPQSIECAEKSIQKT